MCARGVLSILLFPLMTRCLETKYMCISRMIVLMFVVVTMWGSVGKFVL